MSVSIGVLLVFILASTRVANSITKTVLADVMPSSFTCEGRGSGYYADLETGCQTYHFCDGGSNQYSYTCPNNTLFQQRMLICAHSYTVDCKTSEQDYSANLLIGQRDKFFVGSGVFTPASPLVKGAQTTTARSVTLQQQTIQKTQHYSFSPNTRATQANHNYFKPTKTQVPNYKPTTQPQAFRQSSYILPTNANRKLTNSSPTLLYPARPASPTIQSAVARTKSATHQQNPISTTETLGTLSFASKPYFFTTSTPYSTKNNPTISGINSIVTAPTQSNPIPENIPTNLQPQDITSLNTDTNRKSKELSHSKDGKLREVINLRIIDPRKRFFIPDIKQDGGDSNEADEYFVTLNLTEGESVMRFKKEHVFMGASTCPSYCDVRYMRPGTCHPCIMIK